MVERASLPNDKVFEYAPSRGGFSNSPEQPNLDAYFINVLNHSSQQFLGEYGQSELVAYLGGSLNSMFTGHCCQPGKSILKYLIIYIFRV